VVSVVSNKPTVATVNLPTLTFPEGNTAPQVVTVTGVSVGESTITIGRAATTTATNYPTTIDSKTVKATITAGPLVAPKTIFVEPGAGGSGSSPLTPASFKNAFAAASALQQATPNLPVILKVVSVGATNPETLPPQLTEVKAINNGTITIQPEPAAAGGLAQVNLGANFTIGSGVTVNDIKINLSGSNLTIEGSASKLIVGDTNAVEQVTVAAEATVTDSTIILSNDFAGGQGDQLIVKGILKDSTVVANASAAQTAIIKLAKTLDGVTFSCQIGTSGTCIEATAAAAQIINSKVDFDPAAASQKVVNAGTNGVTIIGSVLKQIANLGNDVIAVNHGGGALVVQNSTINLNGNTGGATRAVNSTATSGSIILTGNVFKGYDLGGKPVVEIAAPPGLGATPQQIANNQFQLTMSNAIGIKSNGAPITLINQYATGSGNTFGSSTTPVTNM
jgi:hypothetical protein